jgi:hypothetical protein
MESGSEILRESRLRDPGWMEDPAHRAAKRRREAWAEKVNADPDAYEQEAAAEIRRAVGGLITGIIVEEIRVSGTRPDSRIEVLFRHPSRPECLLGWRWKIWESEYAPFYLDDVEIELAIALVEWIDLKAQTVVSSLECHDEKVVWVGDH